MHDNKEKLLIIVLLLSLLFSIFTVMIVSAAEPTVSAKASVLYEPITKRFIYRKNSKARLGMASTTKIMTALVALEERETDDLIKIDRRAVGVEGSSLYLKEGEVLTVEDMLYALLLRSANDVAAALAYEISGSIEGFAELMNEKAAALGLSDTHFTNPHGLDDPEHYTTAEELAVIAAAALENETLRKIVSTYKKTVGEGTDTQRLVVNHNKLLTLYDDAVGVKTGFTKKCGRTLVGAAERDGLMLISVTLDAPDDWNDHIRLFELGFSLYEARHLVDEGDFCYTVPVVDGEADAVEVVPERTLLAVRRRTDPEIQSEVRLTRYTAAPISQGDILGCVVFTDGEGFTETVRLLAAGSVAKKAEKKRFFGLF